MPRWERIRCSAASRRKGGAHTAAAHSPAGRSIALLPTFRLPALPKRAQGFVDEALPFQVHRVPNVGNDSQLRAGDESRQLLARGDRRQLIERAVDDDDRHPHAAKAERWEAVPSRE